MRLRYSLDHMKIFIAIAAIAALPALAQDQAIKELSKHWATSKTFTLAVAGAMPDANYAFKATPEEMSFGEMVVHIASANYYYCSSAAGTKSPFVKPATNDKATAAKLLAQSFDFCVATVGALKTGDLNKMMGPAGKQSSVRELVLGGFTHTAHHRAQLEVYLRLNHIKPPDYEF
jgi:uncharacterized damage-inducible protein DinB